MVKQIVFSYRTSNGDTLEEVFEFEDTATAEEVETKLQGWIHEHIHVSSQKIMTITGIWVENRGYVGDCPNCNSYIFEEWSRKRCKCCNQPIIWEYNEGDEYDITLEELMEKIENKKKPAL